MNEKIFEALLGAKGVVGVLACIIVAGYMEIWVWGKMHRTRVSEITQDRDRWQALALSTTSLARESAQIVLQQKSEKPS